MILKLLDRTTPDWPAQIDDLCEWLGAPANAALFPLQFLKATFPAIGGKVIVASSARNRTAAGFLFPRDVRDGRRYYTLRFHAPVIHDFLLADMVAVARQALDAEIVLYDPQSPHSYQPTHDDAGTCDIGAPDEQEAARIPAMQRDIWQAGEGFLYPSDLHSPDFRPGSSLVARVAGEIAGVLFGFYRLGDEETSVWWGDHRADLRIESQLLAVDPGYRRLGLGFLLKQRQRVVALDEGIDIIHWTVDPLQYPNALLNIAKLGAVAFDFYPNYYPFRNALNQVAASRFRMTWLLRSPRVARRLAEGGTTRAQPLETFRDALVLHEGATLDEPTDAPYVAIEIPADWTGLQAADLPRASRWRETTDAIFQQLLGIEPGKYVIIDVAAAGERRFIVGRRSVGAATLFEET